MCYYVRKIRGRYECNGGGTHNHGTEILVLGGHRTQAREGRICVVGGGTFNHGTGIMVLVGGTANRWRENKMTGVLQRRPFMST